jgi:large subunit ribosomal protein L29
MKSSKRVQELREKADADLVLREKELAEQLFALRLQRVTGQLEKSSKVREAKQELAQVLTVLRERRSAG